MIYLAKYKTLAGGIKRIDSIPRSPSGKMLKKFLRGKAEREMLEEGEESKDDALILSGTYSNSKTKGKNPVTNARHVNESEATQQPSKPWSKKRSASRTNINGFTRVVETRSQARARTLANPH